MRTRNALLAGAAAAAGLGALALPHRPEPPMPDRVMVVSGPAPASRPAGQRPPAPSVARSVPTAEPTPDPAKAYPYWDGGDPGVWATPAEFSDAE